MPTGVQLAGKAAAYLSGDTSALPRCGVCDRPIMATEPDSTVCGACVCWAMEKFRERLNARKENRGA